jgi:hypothetical protein
MPRYSALLLPAAALALLAGCDIDDSAPTRPRTANFLTPDRNAQDNAEHRTLEPEQRQLPTSGAEFPGQSALPVPSASIVTLDTAPGPAAPRLHPTFPRFPISGFYGPSGLDAIGNTTGPVDTYTRDTYPALIPHLPPSPGAVPMSGATIIPGSDWAADWSWGQGLTLPRAPHRDWRPITATYQVADAPHAPTYYFDLQKHLDVPQYDDTYLSDLCSAACQDLWFFLSTANLPLLMILESPDAVRYTHTYSQDPNFRGHFSAAGSVVPAPYLGVLKWDYSFMNPDGTVKKIVPPTARTRPAPPTQP